MVMLECRTDKVIAEPKATQNCFFQLQSQEDISRSLEMHKGFLLPLSSLCFRVSFSLNNSSLLHKVKFPTFFSFQKRKKVKKNALKAKLSIWTSYLFLLNPSLLLLPVSFFRRGLYLLNLTSRRLSRFCANDFRLNPVSKVNNLSVRRYWSF